MAGSHLASFVNIVNCLSSNQLPPVHDLENPYRHKGDLVLVSVDPLHSDVQAWIVFKTYVEENQICGSCLVAIKEKLILLCICVLALAEFKTL